MEFIFKIDWELLRQQKQWLFLHDCPEAEGLLALIDEIQDQAVAAQPDLESKVFGWIT